MFKEYERLYRASGLKLNANKTECVTLNGNTRTKQVIYVGDNIMIEPIDMITVCGNILSTNRETCYRHNVTNKMDKLEAQLLLWKNRNLTPNGKMIILKHLGYHS